MLTTINIYIQLLMEAKYMKALIDLPIEINQTLNIIKAQHNLKNKAEAITLVVTQYSKTNLEPELRPEFIKKILAGDKKYKSGIKFKSVDELKKRYKIDY